MASGIDSNFIDYVKIHCQSGNGGNGSAHLHRDKISSKGGPDGGDGGRGGHIVLKGNGQLWTLLHLKYRKHIKAKSGINGSKEMRTGGQGEDEILEVPLGTVARDFETNEILFEITEEGEERVLLEGGHGGQGNVHYKSPTRQVPTYAQAGGEAKENWFILELKVLADVGLVGKPNAGKSTLLSVVTAAKPKVADYAFTTLVPNLGVVQYRNFRSFVIADIPGIIEGAHEGKGLGFRFLKHIERNSILLFMVPVDTDDIEKEVKLLKSELSQYKEHLGGKKHVLAITKADMLDDELKTELKQTLNHLDFVLISSVTGEGISELKDVLWKSLQEDIEDLS